jgi:hypothetical protein
MLGSIVRFRAARGLTTAAGSQPKPPHQLPFTLVMAEPPESPLPGLNATPQNSALTIRFFNLYSKNGNFAKTG